MGFLSRTVADARAHAPVVSATAPAVGRTQAADPAKGWEVVEMAFVPESAQTPSSPSPAAQSLSPPSPSGVERAATLPAAPRSAPQGAPGRDDRYAAADPAARAPGDPPGLPVAPSTSSAAPLATARAAMTAPGAPSTPPSHASPRTPVGARIPDSGPAGSAEHTHARVDQRPASPATDDRDAPAHEAPIAQIETTTSPGARTEPAALQATRAAALAPTPLAPIPPAAPRAAAAARNESLVPAPGVEVSPSARTIEPRRPERPSPMPEPAAAPRVYIGRLEVIVVAPSPPPARPARRGSADLASRRYLRNA
jgi:hypothetical protein